MALQKELRGLQSAGDVIEDAYKKDVIPSIDKIFPDRKQVTLSINGQRIKAQEVDIKAGPEVLEKLSRLEKSYSTPDPFTTAIKREVERKASFGSAKMTISQETFVGLVRTDIEDAENYFDEYILGDLQKRYKLAMADKDYYKALWPRLHKRCSIVSTDVRDTIEWILPSLIKIFWGGNEIVTIAGRTDEDDPEPLKSLIHWQIQSRNKGFLIFMQWFRDALEAGLGTVKAWWDRDVQKKTEDYVVGVDEFLQLPPELVVDAKELPNNEYWVRIKNTKYRVNQPKFKNVAPGEYIFSPEVDDDNVPLFGAHRSLVMGSKLMELQKRGVYHDVEKAMGSLNVSKTSMSFSNVDEILRPFRADALLTRAGTADPSRRLYPVYECYGLYDLNGDGIAEPILTTYLNGYIIRKPVINTYNRPPFFTITGYPKSYSQWGNSVGDILEDMQNLKTAMIKQIVSLISANNDRKCGIDADQAQAITDLSEDKAFFRVKLSGGKTVSDVMQFAPAAPMDPGTFSFMEIIQGWIENKTGVTRYNQGLDAKSLNKTATGINAIMGASNQRLELVARIFAETGVVDLFKFFVEMNQKFMDQAQVVRLTNKSMTVRPDDITGEYDIEISAGVGVGSKQAAIENMMILLNQIYPKIVQMGLAGQKEVYNVCAKIVEEMGYKNISDFLINPEVQQAGIPGQPPGVTVPGQVPGAQPGTVPNPAILANIMQAMGGNPQGGGESE